MKCFFDKKMRYILNWWIIYETFSYEQKINYLRIILWLCVNLDVPKLSGKEH
jgi:hypothetical protein